MSECIVEDDRSALALKILRQDEKFYKNIAYILAFFSIVLLFIIYKNVKTIWFSEEPEVIEKKKTEWIELNKWLVYFCFMLKIRHFPYIKLYIPSHLYIKKMVGLYQNQMMIIILSVIFFHSLNNNVESLLVCGTGLGLTAYQVLYYIPCHFISFHSLISFKEWKQCMLLCFTPLFRWWWLLHSVFVIYTISQYVHQCLCRSFYFNFAILFRMYTIIMSIKYTYWNTYKTTNHITNRESYIFTN